MPVRRCILEGRTIRSQDDLYDQLAAGLSFPAHFGRNLDALYDVLTGDLEGPFEIVWKNAGLSKKAMGLNFDRVVKVLRDAQKERDDFTLKIER